MMCFFFFLWFIIHSKHSFCHAEEPYKYEKLAQYISEYADEYQHFH